MARYQITVVRDVAVPIASVEFGDATHAYLRTVADVRTREMYPESAAHTVDVALSGVVSQQIAQHVGYVMIEAENEADALAASTPILAAKFPAAWKVRATDVSLDSAQA